MDTIIHGRYNIISIIGKGKFGVVLKACDNITGEPVAIKRESISSQILSIKHETKIMTHLFQNRFRKLPFVYWYGSQNAFQYLVMTYYDCSLDEYVKSNKFNSDFILEKLFSQCICILENIHKLYVLHRDIKPDNFMIKDGEIYLIDYGLATFWIDGNGKHITNLKQDTIIGTPKYVSYYNYIGNTISRRDDLISLGYMIMYFIYSYLPWQGKIYHFNIKSWKNISEFLENETPVNENAPSIKMLNYMKYCYSLEFDETPNYNLLHTLFHI